MQEPEPPQPLLILGGSCRAAAQSAARAGFAPRAIDLFADADLVALCPVAKINDYPGEFESAARSFPASPWMYTGGLENYPSLVDRIAAERPLLGNSGNVLREVRDPIKLAAALREAGLRHPRVSSSPIPHTQCLRKPRNSGGGQRITMMPAGEAVEPGGAWHFQEFIAGIPVSALFVAASGQAVLLGVSRQLIGEPWTGASGFQYCGSVGPLRPSSERRAEWEQIGNCLAQRYALRGLFGVDAIENEAGIWPVEVNPRYTASVEVLERGLSFDAVAIHVAACQQGTLPAVAPARIEVVCGKAILYARQELTIGPAFSDQVARLNDGHAWPVVADVPRIGTQILAGQPIVSVFADDERPSDIQSRLKSLAGQLELA